MKVVYLSGGVGGARLAHGLARALSAESLTLVVNTGDDLWHWGVRVCPDLDTVMYTLADLADVERGWGLAGESFAALSFVERYGGDTWFALGDRDLATHLMRSQWLRAGERLSSVTARLCRGVGVVHPVLPMSDAACETMIDTPDGTLTFQEWLVRERARPDALRIWFRRESGAATTAATPELLAALDAAQIVIIGPSNPYVSIDPILDCSGVRERIARLPVIAVSPIVRGGAVKGPLARMLATLSSAAPTPQAIADHYGALLSGFVGEAGDALPEASLACHATQTIMTTRADSLRLAHEVVGFAERLLATRT